MRDLVLVHFHLQVQKIQLEGTHNDDAVEQDEVDLTSYWIIEVAFKDENVGWIERD